MLEVQKDALLKRHSKVRTSANLFENDRNFSMGNNIIACKPADSASTNSALYKTSIQMKTETIPLNMRKNTTTETIESEIDQSHILSAQYSAANMKSRDSKKVQNQTDSIVRSADK